MDGEEAALVRVGWGSGGRGLRGCRAGGPRPGELQGRGELLPSELREDPGCKEWLVGEGRRLVRPASEGGVPRGGGSAGLLGGRVWEGSPVSTQAPRGQACGCGIDR